MLEYSIRLFIILVLYSISGVLFVRGEETGFDRSFFSFTHLPCHRLTRSFPSHPIPLVFMSAQDYIISILSFLLSQATGLGINLLLFQLPWWCLTCPPPPHRRWGATGGLGADISFCFRFYYSPFILFLCYILFVVSDVSFLGSICFLSCPPVSISILVSLLLCFCLLFSSYSFFSSSFFSFPLFLLHLCACPMLVILFPRFLLSFLLSLLLHLLFFQLPPAALPPFCCFRSFLGLLSLPFLFLLRRILFLVFLLVLLSLLFLFSLLFSPFWSYYFLLYVVFSSFFCSSSFVFCFLVLSFFFFSSSFGRFFLPFSFPLLTLTFAWFFFLLWFLLSSSSFGFLLVFPLSVFFIVFFSFSFICACILALCGFVSFLFFSPLPAVFLRCFLLSSFSLPLSGRFLLSHPLLGSPSSTLSAGVLSLFFFTFPPVVAVTSWTSILLLLQFPSTFVLFSSGLRLLIFPSLSV